MIKYPDLLENHFGNVIVNVLIKHTHFSVKDVTQRNQIIKNMKLLKMSKIKDGFVIKNTLTAYMHLIVRHVNKKFNRIQNFTI